MNPTWDTHIVSLDLEGINVAKTATSLMIDGLEPFAYNVPGKEPVVSIAEKKNVNPNKITVPPLSIAMHKIDVK